MSSLTPSPAARPSVLAVDDTAANLDLLVGLLGADYDLSVATDGETALETAAVLRPDLVLLDVMMPGMDGYEVCRRLKDSPATSDIPVIFVTALHEKSDTARGFQVGGVDYVSKPFEPEILQARVSTHLRLRQITRDLAVRNDELESIVADRTRRLREAHERLRLLDSAKDDYLGALSHELRTPANGVLGIAEIALDSFPDERERSELKIYFDRARDRLLQTIDSALLLSSHQSGDGTLRRESIRVGDLLSSVLQNPEVDLDCPPPAGSASPARTLGNPDLLGQALVTLALAARKFHRNDGRPSLRVQITNTSVGFDFDSSGFLPPDQLLQTFFDVFSHARASSHAEELGLRVPLARKIILAHGGDVRLQAVAPSGLRLSAFLPRDIPAA